jgi:hypothetical protein
MKESFFELVIDKPETKKKFTLVLVINSIIFAENDRIQFYDSIERRMKKNSSVTLTA